MTTFSSLENFIEVTNNAKPNKYFASRPYVSSRYGSYKFCHTYSWEEAEQLLENGYEEGLKLILSDKGGIDLNTQRSRIIRKDDFVGQRPNIVNTIMGKPKTMVHRIKREVPMKNITFYYNNYPTCKIKTSQMIRAGKNFIALVKFFENNGYRVAINIIMPTVVDNDGKDGFDYKGIAPVVKLKDFRQALNPLMIAYPLVHPSFIRRHLFRYIETSEFTNTSAWRVMGFPACDNLGADTFRRDLLKHNIIDNKTSFFIDWHACEAANSVDDILYLSNFPTKIA